MSLPIQYRPEELAELLEAAAWYDEQRLGLGDEMTGCVQAGVASVARAPELHPVVHGNFRRVLVRRFPYAVFYTVEDGALLVLAVSHVRRQPGYWLDRSE